MMNREQVIQKWSGENGMKLLWPGKVKWPDEDCVSTIREVCGDGTICEIGCGAGRVAEVFEPGCYVGVDINPLAIDRAKATLPDHKFMAIKWDDEYPKADVYLFYTVLLHVPDDSLLDILARCMEAKRIVVFESMCRRLRNFGEEFQRDLADYEIAFRSVGKVLVHHRRMLSEGFPHFRDYAVFREPLRNRLEQTISPEEGKRGRIGEKTS